ncbi:MAG: hypothetical protein U0Q18_15370 [Bryobacteraceae bacterium]
MLLAVSRIAILAASFVVPRAVRRKWRRAWTGEVRHYSTLLRTRGLKRRYIHARIWHHSAAAFRSAWRLACATPGMRWFRAVVRKPEFCLGLIGVALLTILVFSHGLAITRAMLAPPYPEPERLVLVSEASEPVGERYPVSPEMLEFWREHNTSFTGLAGFRWDSRGTAWITPGFFEVVGTHPRRLLLHPIKEWRPAAGSEELGVIGRLKAGITIETAQEELRRLGARYRHSPAAFADLQAQVTPFVGRIRQPFYTYILVCLLTASLLLLAAVIGIRADRRRSGHIRRRYWAFFCAKAVLLPVVLALVIWEFTRATSFKITGGPMFVAEPFFIWLVILACGAIVWWSLADQRVRCRACVQTLQYPVRIGSLGAVLFDHAGLELMCCDGHGALYVPAVSSDYVQGGGWTALDSVV